MDNQQATPQKARNQLRRTILKSFVIPALVLLFFMAAPSWLNSRLQSSAAGSVRVRPDMTAEQRQNALDRVSHLDFQAVCLGNAPQYERLREELTKSGLTGQFQRLRWGLIVSWMLMGGLVVGFGALFSLNQKARKSKADLIAAFQTSSKIVMAMALVNVFLLIPLLTYGCFEFTVLLTGRFFPKLLLFIVLGGIFALWTSAKILLTKVPLQFEESMARELTPEEAPELWRVVREAAARLQTAPPDRIIAGLQFSFYVTELAVRISAGLVEGRVLYLSYPLLKQLSEQETLAIIGHELGHFIGEDTRLTREFYPLRLKARAILIAMARSGLVGWPSFQLLCLFHGVFGETEQAASRERELLADKKGAELTSAESMGRALLKFQVAAEAFSRGIRDSMRNQSVNPLEIPLQSIVRSQLANEPVFWTKLFEQKLPHPLDSHPPLQVRLESLGQSIDVAQAQSIALEEPASAYALWFAGRETLFAGLAKQAEQTVAAMRERTQVKEADYGTVEGKELLDKHFPMRKWHAKSAALWVVIGLLSAAIIGCVAMILCIEDFVPRCLAAGAAVFLGFLGFVALSRHYGGELTLSVESLFYSGWKRPLRFEDVEKITAQRSASSIYLHFRLKKRQLSPWKFSVSPFYRRTVTFSIGGMDAKPDVIAQTIFQYMTRQTPHPQAPAE